MCALTFARADIGYPDLHAALNTSFAEVALVRVSLVIDPAKRSAIGAVGARVYRTDLNPIEGRFDVLSTEELWIFTGGLAAELSHDTHLPVRTYFLKSKPDI